jgi:hypothetical protein
MEVQEAMIDRFERQGKRQLIVDVTFHLRETGH